MPHSTEPDDDGRRASLVAMIEGDPERLRRRSISLGVARDDAEDVAQTALLRAWRSIEHLQAPEPGQMCAWLDTIARNAAIDLARQKARRPAVRLDDGLGSADGGGSDAAGTRGAAAGVIVAAPANVSGEVETRLLLDGVLQAINELPESLRRPLLLSVADELPAAEIAERLGITTAAVRQRITRARRALAGCRQSGMSDACAVPATSGSPAAS
ncbi:RNA polymerase sigma factor [Agromyces aureus]|uniref:RNA polymerase subunit sigma n=1 Tax=Agromyces aureus TaxID=453304 RepID=A0A191WJK0_9MICO|nr:RNA polymerase sigma factor [Agromyces aureus]ANJ28505.1 RNA polymerase subunit sigma [Agromyces aureus]